MGFADRLRKGDWAVVSVPFPELVEMVEMWHYSKSAPNTATYRHGLQNREDWRYYGGCLWIPPTKNAALAVCGDHDWRGVLACSRLVVAPEVPTNGASFLLGQSMRLVDRERWPVLVTYADTRLGHTGAIYRATNWRCDGEVPAGDVWIGPDGEQRGRKRGSKTLLAAEMRERGFVKAAAAPKIRYVHAVR